MMGIKTKTVTRKEKIYSYVCDGCGEKLAEYVYKNHSYTCPACEAIFCLNCYLHKHHFEIIPSPCPLVDHACPACLKLLDKYIARFKEQDKIEDKATKRVWAITKSWKKKCKLAKKGSE